MKEWYTAQELIGLPGLPSTDRRIRARAEKEGWQSRSRQIGKGLEYHFSALLPDAQLALLSIDAAPILAATPAPPKPRAPKSVEDPAALAAARAEGDAQAAQLRGKARTRMDARLEILREFEQFSRENRIEGSRKVGGKLQKAAFATAWNRGEIASPARDSFPTLSSDKLERWSQQLRLAGLVRLAGRYGHRAGAGLIDSQPQLASALRALLLEYPHIKPGKAAEWLAARYEALPAALAGDGPIPLPGPRTIGRWLDAWKRDHAELYARIRNPDDWKNRYMIGWGNASEAIVRLNQLWEFDSTPADVLLKDGRHSILGVIDVYSRRVRLHISKTSRATAVASLLRSALLDWGVPEIAKTDNGQEYVSNHVQRIFQTLEIEQHLSEPFSPWQKPFIERFFRTFSHDLIEYLPGYIGHNVAEREALRARQQFSDRLFVKNSLVTLALDATELQAFCDRWLAGYHDRPHAGIDSQRPLERLAGWRQPIRTVANERALDLLLSEAPGDGWRTVTKSYGLRIDSFEYIAVGLPIGERVRPLYDPEGDMGRVVVFDGKGQFLAIAECPEITGIDRRELAAHAKAAQRGDIAGRMKALRDEARPINVKTLANDLLDQREANANKLIAFPKKTEAHATGYLEGAVQALEAQRERPAEVVSADAMNKLRAEQAEAALKAAAEAEEPDFDSPYGRARWIFERVFYGKWSLTQVPAKHRAFLRHYYQTDAGRGVNLDRYLSDFHPRFGEVKTYLLREESAGADESEQAAG